MKIDPTLKGNARALRKNLSPAERILWKSLRGRRFAGFKFRRQHPWGNYILDFYCPDASVVVEVDGETHLGREKEDSQRTRWLEQQGLKIFRVWNNQVYDELESVLEGIYLECMCRSSSPLLRGEGPGVKGKPVQGRN